jgi:hypothetical protein
MLLRGSWVCGVLINGMKFTVAPTDRANQLLLLQGVPRSLLGGFTMDVTTALANLEIAGEKKSRVVLANQQRRWFQQVYKQLPLQPLIMVCASTEFYLQARRTGLVMFWRYLMFSLNYPKEFNNSRPLWHSLDASFRNPLLAAYQKGEHQAANLLILDNVYQDMPLVKLDKTRDLLQCFCDRPRLLLLHGIDPYNYCRQRLGVQANYIFNINRQLRREVI